ncbi:MAG: hypothetical protein VW683_00540 [Betaproteobacteria bacterium]|jgi:hypothetical protein
MSQNTRLRVTRGETFTLPVNLKNADSTPIDITGYSFTGSVKETYSSTDSKFFTISTVPPLASGSLELSLDTADMKAGEYVYTVMLQSESVRRTILEGQFLVRQSTL